MEDLSKVKFNGEKLFKIRKKKRMSQEILAAKVGVTRQTIYSWESNQRLPDVEKVGRLCKVLNINLSDLVDGIIEQENSENIQTEKQNVEKNRNIKRIIIRLITVLIIISIIAYIIISTIKFVRLNRILNNWETLNQLDSYYIKIKEISQIDKENSNSFNTDYYEKYYNNGVLKTVLKDSDDKNIKNITIDDYNEKIKYIIYEDDKTYVKKKFSGNQNNTRFIDNFYACFKYSDNLFFRYIFCMNPQFKIEYNDFYELEDDSENKEYVERDTGLIRYAEIFDKNSLNTRFFYEYELNTGKDFEINLADYTEVTE